MGEQEIQQTLMWLAERVDQVDKAAGGGDPFLVHHPCSVCGHGRYAHVADGENNPWPCEYPKILGSPVALCTCDDFQPLGGPDE